MSAPNLFPDVTKQNITSKLYMLSLINNSDVEISSELTTFVNGILERIFESTMQVQHAIDAGELTPDTYILYPVFIPAPLGEIVPFDAGPTTLIVDTAARILELYPD